MPKCLLTESRQRVVFCQRQSWRLCLHGVELDNRADPLALGSS